GLVVGTDLVPAMLATAVRRAQAAGAAKLSFAACDMECMPFRDGWFDRATCRFGIMFAPHPAKALTEIRRVLRPGGRLAMMVWGPRADNTLFREVGAAVETAIGHRPEHLSDFATLFRYAAPGSLGAPLAQAGFELIEEHDLKPVGRVPADRPFWQATLDMTFAHAVFALDAAPRKALEADIIGRFGGLAEGGQVALHIHARIVTAVKPV
ncbi:MAG TPA: methyltransferase domain-containing protein, partial [Azospirillaceae bacterium]|nr:methyltransferase domain-containing protein [Azospirillaceae bacterium]